MRRFLLLVEKAVIKLPLKYMESFFYDLLTLFDKENNLRIMNYGYLGKKHLKLNGEDEPIRYGLQLYNHAVRNLNLKGKSVLEVGSGRGGGANYLAKTLKPKQYIALDFSRKAIEFCQKYYNQKDLKFVWGEAHRLPIIPEGFDVVLGVESSHNYFDEIGFFKQVYKVLRPGGYFSLVVPRLTSQIDQVINSMEEIGFIIKSTEDLTENVIKTLDKDGPRRRSLIKKYAPAVLKKYMEIFVALPGSPHYNSFKNRTTLYLLTILQKPAQ